MQPEDGFEFEIEHLQIVIIEIVFCLKGFDGGGSVLLLESVLV